MSFQFEPEEEIESSRRTTAIVLGMIAAFLIIVPLIILFVFVGGGDDKPAATPTSGTEVVFDDPSKDGREVTLGEKIEILVSARDPVGIDSIELRVGNTIIGTLSGEDGIGEPPQFIFQWTPDRIGSRRLEAIATNLQGDESEPVSITVNVIRGDATGTETPGSTATETETPGPTDTGTETETPTGTPTVRDGALPGTLNQGANVRAEADESSERLGSVERGAQVEVVGRNDDDSWLQIIWPLGSSSDSDTAWIFAQFIEVDGQISDLPVNATATPTETPTEETGLDLEPTDLNVGSGDSLEVTITNNGPEDLPAQSISVSVELDGANGSSKEIALPDLASGESTTRTVPGITIDSTTDVVLLVDSADDIEETDEDNNEISQTLGPAAQADITIVDFGLTGDDNHFEVTLRNDGDAAINGATVVIRISRRNGLIGSPEVTVTLAPGEDQTIELEPTLNDPAHVTITIFPTDPSIDANDQNNLLEKDLEP